MLKTDPSLPPSTTQDTTPHTTHSRTHSRDIQPALLHKNAQAMETPAPHQPPMRTLFYVPILHTDADLGSLATPIKDKATPLVGAHSLQYHHETVTLYWRALASYWDAQPAAGLKIFQDAMATDGTAAIHIVKSLAAKGSLNYMIIDHLLAHGALLVKTEDPVPLQEEYLLTRNLTTKQSLLGIASALLQYNRRKDALLKARDTAIITSISDNLHNGDTGVCFLGADHQILAHLPADLTVITLKDPKKVQAYAHAFRHHTHDQTLQTLRAYLIAPITHPQGEQTPDHD